MPTTVYDLNGYPNGTDAGSVTGITRAFGAAGELVVNADGQMDVTTANQTLLTMNAGAQTHEIHTKFGSGGGGTSNMVCAVRVTDVNNAYYARFVSGNAEVWQRVGGTFTNLASVAATFGAADELGLKYNHSNGKLTAYKNRVAITGLIDIIPANTLSDSTLVGFHGRSQGAADLITEFTVITAASQSLTDINSGADLSGDTSGNTYTTSGFTENITSVTIAGFACTSVTYSSNAGTFTVPPPTHAAVYPMIGQSQTVQVSGATQSATLAKNFVLTGRTVTTLSSPNTTDPHYPTYHFDVTPINGDSMITVDADMAAAPGADGWISVNDPITTIVIHQIASSGVTYIYSFVITEEGVQSRGLVAVGLTATGLTATGLTAIGV